MAIWQCVVCGDDAAPRGTAMRCFICGDLGCGRLGCGIAHFDGKHEHEGPRYLKPAKRRGKVNWRSSQSPRLTGARAMQGGLF